MRQICAWCRTEIGTIPSTRHADEEVSHGICPDCVSNFAFQQGASLQQFIDTIALPVVVVDDDGRVRSANAAACRSLGREAVTMQGQRGGSVFECAHARLPEGCGRTIHCSGCTIRRAVSITHATGEPQSRVPATLTRGVPGAPSSVDLVITTVKVGDMVMLRIDRME